MAPEMAPHFRHMAYFTGGNAREAVNDGRAEYIPIYLYEIGNLVLEGFYDVDAVLCNLSPPDEHGFCSFGVGVDVTKPAAEKAKYVIAQVNPQVPRTLGDSFIHVRKLTHIVEVDEPLKEMPGAGYVSEKSMKIGGYIAGLIEDGSTMQMGIGEIPDAVLASLGGHKDLGVHTEMFSDGVMELIKEGVITNEKKTIHKGKVIASFSMGSRELYEFIDENPMFEMHPSEYTNNPFVIARNARMVAINSALQIDLTGQICSDSLGYKFYSGIGGQVDFIRGSAMSKGGKPIIAVPSTAEDGKVSRIVPNLEEGSGVVTTRGDVHFVATEHGVAYLHGKSIRDRAMSLIQIAHPRFRDSLLQAAKERGFVYPDQQLVSTAVYPARYERREEFEKGLKIFFRPVRPDDERGIQRLFHRLSPQSRYYRFFTAMTAFPHRKAQEMAVVDYAGDMAIVGILPMKEEHEEQKEIVAAAQYMVSGRSGFAEVAVMVSDEYHNRGIGSFLIRYLIQIARENGIKGFIADVLAQNKAMLRVFLKSGYDIHLEQDEGDYHLSFDFEKPGEPQRVPPAAG
jgi:acyl-CoA hydrolase/GNAT superfamily N-acetyltransferase